jgi:hypothetical protein
MPGPVFPVPDPGNPGGITGKAPGGITGKAPGGLGLSRLLLVESPLLIELSLHKRRKSGHFLTAASCHLRTKTWCFLAYSPEVKPKEESNITP